MSAIRTPADITENELRCSEFYKEAERDLLEAFQRVLASRVSDHPLGFAEARVDWTEFEQNLARFCDLARIRHMAKHNAIREAMLVTRPIVVVREEDGRTRVLEAVPPPFIDELLKRRPPPTF